MELDYVISGPAHIMADKSNFSDDSKVSKYRELWGKFQNELNQRNMMASWLFNGYTEEGLGETLTSTFDKAKFYVDSGGLQMITLGKTSTDELKEKVYKVQSRLATYAMSFDEIPVKLSSGRSSTTGFTDRYVDVDNFDEYAKLSAKNLKNQTRFFIDNQSKAKPFIIVQGYSFESYQRWLDIMLDELSDDEIKAIGGLSCGAASLGQGTAEDTLRAFICAKLQAPEHIMNHIHLLGVGSLKRLLPYFVLEMNGTLNVKKLSFDSTTLTSSMSRCNYYMNHRLLGFRGENPFGFHEVINDFQEKSKRIFGFDVSDECFKDSYTIGNTRFKEKYGDSHLLQQLKLVGLFCNVLNFMDSCHTIRQGGMDAILELFGYDSSQFVSFMNVKTYDDFLTWENANQSQLQSKRINTTHSTNIEDFFS